MWAAFGAATERHLGRPMVYGPGLSFFIRLSEVYFFMPSGALYFHEPAGLDLRRGLAPSSAQLKWQTQIRPLIQL